MAELTKEQTADMEAAWEVYSGFESKRSLLFPQFKVGYTAAVNRECVWTWRGTVTLDTSCGEHAIGNKSLRPDAYCRYCGGKVMEEN